MGSTQVLVDAAGVGVRSRQRTLDQEHRRHSTPRHGISSILTAGTMP